MNENKTILHPHALLRLAERGANEAEVVLTVESGEQFLAKHGRTGFRLNFIYNNLWNGKYYTTKQIEAPLSGICNAACNTVDFTNRHKIQKQLQIA